jgi:hypothetical protein
MGKIYVKLKEDYCKQKNPLAVDIYGQLLYPGQNCFATFDEKWLKLIENHRNFQDLDIKTQDVIDEEKKQYKEEIDDIVTGSFLRSEKRIQSITDKNKLQNIIKTANMLQKNKIARVAKECLDELNLSSTKEF